MFPQGTAFLLSSRLDSAVKRCSSEVLVSSGAAQQRVWPETSEVLIRSEVVGVAKAANNYNDLVKGSSTRKKLQNSNGYAESPEFSPALRLIIFGKKFVATNLR